MRTEEEYIEIFLNSDTYKNYFRNDSEKFREYCEKRASLYADYDRAYDEFVKKYGYNSSKIDDLRVPYENKIINLATQYGFEDVKFKEGLEKLRKRNTQSDESAVVRLFDRLLNTSEKSTVKSDKSNERKSIIANLIKNTDILEAQFESYGLRVSSFGYDGANTDYMWLKVLIEIISTNGTKLSDDLVVHINLYDENGSLCARGEGNILSSEFSGIWSNTLYINSDGVALTAQKARIFITKK